MMGGPEEKFVVSYTISNEQLAQCYPGFVENMKADLSEKLEDELNACRAIMVSDPEFHTTVWNQNYPSVTVIELSVWIKWPV